MELSFPAQWSEVFLDWISVLPFPHLRFPQALYCCPVYLLLYFEQTVDIFPAFCPLGSWKLFPIIVQRDTFDIVAAAMSPAQDARDVLHSSISRIRIRNQIAVKSRQQLPAFFPVSLLHWIRVSSLCST